MFNWASAPTFLAMLLFWLLAAYVLTRSPRSPISLTAVAAQVATALFLLSQGMQANAQTLEQWLPWARILGWGPHLAHLLWYWLTVLLLREQATLPVQRYLRVVAYPLGVLYTVGTVGSVASLYVDDWLHVWSAVGEAPPDSAHYGRFSLPDGPLFIWFLGLIAATTSTALVNVWLGWRCAVNSERRRRFAWLLLSAVFFALGANAIGIVDWLTHGLVPAWLGHSLLAFAMVVMAWNVAAYSLLFKGPLNPRDFFYFLTVLLVMCGLYGLVILLTPIELTFANLGLTAIILSLVVVSHALVDLARQVLDRFFFGSDVRHFRANLASAAQNAALTPNLETVLQEAHAEIAEVSSEHLVRLTEQALRRLNNPAALARCGLLDRLPNTLAAAREAANGSGVAPTPLERARVVREVLVAAIEGLKPADGDVGIGSAGGLQYNILREEYLQGLLNKQIMARHSLSEGTFHRNRRQAIWTIAQELESREERLRTSLVPVS